MVCELNVKRALYQLPLRAASRLQIKSPSVLSGERAGVKAGVPAHFNAMGDRIQGAESGTLSLRAMLPVQAGEAGGQLSQSSTMAGTPIGRS